MNYPNKMLKYDFGILGRLFASLSTGSLVVTIFAYILACKVTPNGTIASLVTCAVYLPITLKYCFESLSHIGDLSDLSSRLSCVRTDLYENKEDK